MTVLEKVVGEKYTIPVLETSILSSVVLFSATSNYLFEYETVEVFVPIFAAFSAGLSFASECIGRKSTAEAEVIGNNVRIETSEAAQNMARALNAKSIIPLCVTVATAASIVNALIPALLVKSHCVLPELVKDALLITFPIVAIIACDVAELASIETLSVCRDIFSKKNTVGDLELGQQSKNSIRDLKEGNKNLILDLAGTTLISPIIGILAPGSFATKCAICSAVAAMQCTYYLTTAEWGMCRGLDRYTLISRCATVSEAYANQGGRSLAVLPYTASLTALTAASSAAAMEAVPLIPNINLQAIATTVFPVLGALCAAASSVAKARCEVDAEAAKVAATAIQSNSRIKQSKAGRDDDGVLQPGRRVLELLRLTTMANFGDMLSKSRWRTKRA
eukprot:CAMPEP_0185769818 /NCGR_PEP_ID=MMETSP1174-20130828/56019_1 /TAXON_ID=35687 /ORGANISM="Dictyocha speculum, Strain CCMP1381" /LENGTH=392 /DNA_ID=CAMNT_0028455025 /DNA_START=309 /DNA_END=1487 /DNA_ORIENTATION=+